MLPFGSVSLSGCSVRTDLEARPQRPLGPPYRLTISADNLAELQVADLRLGMESPFLSAGPVPAALFGALAPAAPIHASTVGVGQTVVLGLVNMSCSAQRVTAVLSGTMAPTKRYASGLGYLEDERPSVHPNDADPDDFIFAPFNQAAPNARRRLAYRDPLDQLRDRELRSLPAPPKDAPAHVWAAWVELTALRPPTPGSSAEVWELYYRLYRQLVQAQRESWSPHPLSPTTRVREHEAPPEVSAPSFGAAAPASAAPEPAPAPPAAEQPTCEARRPDFGERCERPAGHRHDHEAGDLKWPQQKVPSRRELQDNDRYLSDADNWGAWESPTDES